MNVCMICTGNTCRSPMAEAFLRQALEDIGVRGVSVCSAGISAADGMPASADAVLIMREYGIDLTMHRSCSVFRVPEDSLFLCMTRSHLEMLKQAFPDARAQLLFEYAGLTGEVSDPYALGLYAYRAAASKIERAAVLAADRIYNEITALPFGFPSKGGEQ